MEILGRVLRVWVSGWTGVLCDIEVNECDSAPCQNGGVCIDFVADYSCACHFGKSIFMRTSGLLFCIPNLDH